MSPWILRDRLRRGDWSEPVPGIIATGPVTGLGRAAAALLRAGADAALSHQSAARSWLDRDLTGTLHILTPYGVKIRPISRGDSSSGSDTIRTLAVASPGRMAAAPRLWTISGREAGGFPMKVVLCRKS